MYKGDDVYDVTICYMKFLKYNPFLLWIESVHHIELENNPINVKVQGAFDAMNYNFTTTFSCNFE
jgi:ABC-type polysaccharide/polyol phosphate export permease